MLDWTARPTLAIESQQFLKNGTLCLDGRSPCKAIAFACHRVNHVHFEHRALLQVSDGARRANICEDQEGVILHGNRPFG